MTSALKASTYETYGSAWRSWETYCADVKINTWAADVWQGADYLHWLADRGTVNLSQCTPYTAAVNGAYTAMRLPPPLRGPVPYLSRVSLAARQRDTRPALRQRALPAEDAATLYYLTVDPFDEHWPRTDADFVQAGHNLAILTMYLTGSRPTSIRKLPAASGVCFTATDVIIHRKYTKDDDDAEGGDHLGHRPVNLPKSTFQTYAEVMVRFAAERDQRFPGAPWFFSISSEGFSSIAPLAYFRNWYAENCPQPPAGCVYTLRSLRSGFASGAISIGVQSGRVNYVGGWVPGSPTMDRFYVDYTFVAYGYARWFFGHLLVA